MADLCIRKRAADYPHAVDDHHKFSLATSLSPASRSLGMQGISGRLNIELRKDKWNATGEVTHQQWPSVEASAFGVSFHSGGLHPVHQSFV